MTLLSPLGFPEEQWPRLGSALRRIEAMIWRVEAPVVAIEATTPAAAIIPHREAISRPLERLGELPVFWGRLFDQRWCRVRLPRAAEKGDWLWWRGQGETTVYVDGEPIGGTDTARSRVRLREGATELWVEWVCENIGILIDDASEHLDPLGCRFDGAFLAKRNDAAWRSHTDFSLLLDVLDIENAKAGGPAKKTYPWGPRHEMNRATPMFRRLLDRLSFAVDTFDHEGLEALEALLRAIRAELRGGDPLMSATLTGHAHIDLVWRWPERLGVFKATHTFANALGLIDQDDSFRFGYSQPASYEAVAEHAPGLIDRVRARIAEGRWEASGMLHVESDTQLPCGEALARSFLIGQRGFEALAGQASRTLWLPDAFGFSGCLPQLIRESGGDSFFTTKAQWSGVNRFPHAAFVWRGADGSEVAGFVPGDFDYNGEATASRVHQAALQQRQASVFPRTLLPTGHGDGGGGPTEEMCRRAEVMADLAGLPKTSWGRIDAFFDELHGVREQLPVWEGEIYLEYHRGVQTTGVELKSAFRAAERAMQASEAAAVVTGQHRIDENAWKRLIFAQFHDAVPGSSIGEVYAELIPELRDLASTQLKDTSRTLTTGGEPCLFNPLPFERTILYGDERHHLAPLSGTSVMASCVGRATQVTASISELRSDRVHITLDEAGHIAGMVVDGRSARIAAPMAGVMAFADEPHAFEAWDIDRASLERASPARAIETIEIERGRSEASVLVKRRLAKRSSLETRYTLFASEPVVRIAYTINTDEPGMLFKAVFPTGYRGVMARYGSPFGSALRGTRPGRRCDEAAFEVPASRWATVCDDGEREGLCVVAESSYGFGCQSGTMHLSLLRTSLVTATGLTTELRSGDRGPTHFDMGGATLNIAIGLVAPDAPLAERPAALADHLFTRAIAYQGVHVDGGLRAIDTTGGVVPAWAKPAERGDGSWVLRLHETHGQPGSARLQLADGWSASRVDLREQPCDEGLSRDGDMYVAAVRANAFTSVLITRELAEELAVL